MDAESAKWLVSQGIGAALAMGMFLYYRRDVHNALNSWKDQTKVLAGLVQQNATALQSNSDAVRENTEAVRAMEATLPFACPLAEQARDQRR